MSLLHTWLRVKLLPSIASIVELMGYSVAFLSLGHLVTSLQASPLETDADITCKLYRSIAAPTELICL